MTQYIIDSPVGPCSPQGEILAFIRTLEELQAAEPDSAAKRQIQESIDRIRAWLR